MIPHRLSGRLSTLHRPSVRSTPAEAPPAAATPAAATPAAASQLPQHASCRSTPAAAQCRASRLDGTWRRLRGCRPWRRRRAELREAPPPERGAHIDPLQRREA
eukprot:1282541-Prymnesium_polylepis.1